jgi:hypothetical protein
MRLFIVIVMVVDGFNEVVIKDENERVVEPSLY